MTERTLQAAAPYTSANSAFISYAREDEQIAAALQAALIELARANPIAAQEQRLRVFRDVTNLVPGQGLTDALRQQLASSEKLIILASPHAARSPWVRMELRTFLETKSSADVIVVLVGGELAWDNEQRTYSPSERNGFPDLGRSIFATEPLHLDLRSAAASTHAPTLRDASFRDAVAALLVAIVGGRKDDIVGLYVDTHRRSRAQLSVNLSFRGATGFALSALLTAVVVLQMKGATAGEFGDLHRGLGLVLIIASSVPICGFGAFVCRLGFRGYLATTASFVLAVPFFAAGTMRAFEGSLFDEIGLAAASLAGFCCAGVAFSRVFPRFNTGRVTAIFAAGSVLASLPFLLFDGIRQGEIDFQIFAFPWLLERLTLVARALADVSVSILPWAVAIACAAWIGALLGMEQARIELPALTKTPERRVVHVFRRVWGRAAIGAAIIAVVAVLYVRSPWNQIPSVAADLNPAEVDRNLREGLLSGESTGRLVRFGFDARDALRRAGQQKPSEEMASLIRKWISGYLERLEDRYVVVPGLSESLQAHAKEAEPILRKSIADAGQISVRLALLARVARRMGADVIADFSLNESLKGLSAASTSETRGQVAVALADAARISEATALLEDSKIATNLEAFPCNQDFARVLWITGIWRKLPEPLRREWSCNSGLAVAMMETQDWEEALDVLQTAIHLVGFRETSILAAVTAAADQGRFDIAQRAANLLQKNGEEWTSYAESQRAIGERAFSRHDEHALADAETNLEHLLREAGLTSYYSYLTDLQLSYWKLEYLAGNHEKAAWILKSMSTTFEAAEALVTQARAEMQGQRRMLAKRTLARAWSLLHEAQGRIDPQCETLGKISTQLLSMNERVGARTIAEECRPWRFEHYWLERYVALAGILDAYTR